MTEKGVFLGLNVSEKGVFSKFENADMSSVIVPSDGGGVQGIGAYGAFDGGPQCRMSILKNGNVPVAIFFNVPVLMLPVDFKKRQCPLSLFFRCSCRL